jgi:Rps23 Pro-64 3,4-dihydroxylase Tpa1-like proline 4-hydroxylase
MMIPFSYWQLKPEEIPFKHIVIDNFLDDDVVKKLQDEFLDYDSPQWLTYNNPVEHKKTLNNWNAFPATTYSVFSELCSLNTTQWLSTLMGDTIHADMGLHGGGWHIHNEHGILNPHLDYHRHPKLSRKRKINLLIYLSDLDSGHLGFWEGSDSPAKLVKEIEPRVNRCVIFDTEGSWHGMSRPISGKGIYRKSLAVYYLSEFVNQGNTRALFSHQDDALKDFCKERSNYAGSPSNDLRL